MYSFLCFKKLTFSCVSLGTNCPALVRRRGTIGCLPLLIFICEFSASKSLGLQIHDTTSVDMTLLLIRNTNNTLKKKHTHAHQKQGTYLQ